MRTWKVLRFRGITLKGLVVLSCNFVLPVAAETVEMPGFSTSVTRGFSACQTKLAGTSN